MICECGKLGRNSILIWESGKKEKVFLDKGKGRGRQGVFSDMGNKRKRQKNYMLENTRKTKLGKDNFLECSEKLMNC